MIRAQLRAVCIGLVLVLAATAVAAETAPSDPDVKPRIVKPPSKSAGRRILIQIDPEEQARRLAAPKPPMAGPERPSGGEHTETAEMPADDPFRAFWTLVSPRIEDANPGRLDATLLALDAVDALRWPRLDDLRWITDTYGRDILRHTVGTNVSPALVAAIISVESSGRVDAVSSAGATGLMQLMPATAERFGVTDRTVSAESIKGGVAYLNWLMEEFGSDPVMILAGYNAGEGAVRNNSGVPPYSETRAYVPKVLAAFRVASGLCRTPPQYVTDPCIFIGMDS